MTCSKNKCKFSNLPFFWHPLTDYHQNEFPETLPFELVYQKETGIFSQKENKQITGILKRSYKRGAYFEGLMDDNGIGSHYAEDFMGFINGLIGLDKIFAKAVLEIGCGTGYLLDKLEALGADVLGFEPGYAAIGKYSVRVIKKFFPAHEIKEKRFDIIIAFALLEHVENPEVILEQILGYLKDDGFLIISVPDCENQINAGDISMLIHEHFSYFIPDTLKFLAEHSGYASVAIKKSAFGGSIYGAFKKNLKNSIRPQVALPVFTDIFGKIKSNLDKMNDFLQLHTNQCIGIYVPIRALNTLYLFKNSLERLNITLRFFDDSEYLRGKYFPGFQIPVESGEKLVKDPCDVVLIYSYTFAQKIYEKIKVTLPPSCEIVCLKDLYL